MFLFSLDIGYDYLSYAENIKLTCYSLKGDVCNDKTKYGIIETNQLNLAFRIAHELGH